MSEWEAGAWLFIVMTNLATWYCTWTHGVNREIRKEAIEFTEDMKALRERLAARTKAED